MTRIAVSETTVLPVALVTRGPKIPSRISRTNRSKAGEGKVMSTLGVSRGSQGTSSDSRAIAPIHPKIKRTSGTSENGLVTPNTTETPS